MATKKKKTTTKSSVNKKKTKTVKLVEIIELPKDIHPYFIATQFHPEYESSVFKPHPLFIRLLQSKI